MSTLRFSILTLISAIGFGCGAQTMSQQDQMTQAVKKVYDLQIAQNPSNYNALYRRANHYYGLNDYAPALADVNAAIAATPDKEKDLLLQEYSLRANINEQLGAYEDALTDLNRLVKADPQSYTHLYRKANILYSLGRYSDAKTDYAALQKMNPRSLEAMIGLARVAVRENDPATANTLLDRAVQLYPSSIEAWLRRASVRRMLGNEVGAVDDIITALSLDPANERAVKNLFEISDINYNAVISGLTGAISRSQNSATLYYIRAGIAQAHYRYAAAAADYSYLIDRRIYTSAQIHASLAQCLYALMHFDDAIREINTAIGLTVNNAPYLTLSAEIRLAMGKPEVALMTANSALEKMPDAYGPSLCRARALIALGRWEDARDAFCCMIANNPERPLPYIAVAWVLAEKLGAPADAHNYLERCVALDFAADDPDSLRGFAYNLLGRNDEADAWIDGILGTGRTMSAQVAASAGLGVPDIDGRRHYIAAALYSQMGNLPSAVESAGIALSRGYSDLYQWKAYTLANLDVAPLRSFEPFQRLLSTYGYLFDVK